MTVVDDGRGISSDERINPLSMGLIGMHERARTEGGTVEISNNSDGGTSICVRLPKDKEKALGL
jgi:signal transduction histidine kinase